MPRPTKASPSPSAPSQDSPLPDQPDLTMPDQAAPLTDWTQINPTLFGGVDLDNREAVNIRSKDVFDQFKATRLTHPEKLIRHAFNSALHEAIGRAARAAKQAKSAVARVEKAAEGSAVKGKLKQHIKAQAKAKADATLLTDAVLAQLEELGVDLTPLKDLT